MSEAVAAKRIRAGRAAYDFPCIFRMIACGELHLSGVHQLAAHLTADNHEEVLQRAKHRSMREIEQLIAEIAPKPDVPASIRAHIRREVCERDEGRCAFVDAKGRRCQSGWQVEFHHCVPYARGGPHSVDNIELRCRAHNQYEADLEYGALFMEVRRA